jgi:hypothetical protein
MDGVKGSFGPPGKERLIAEETNMSRKRCLTAVIVATIAVFSFVSASSSVQALICQPVAAKRSAKSKDDAKEQVHHILKAHAKNMHGKLTITSEACSVYPQGWTCTASGMICPKPK